MKLLVTGASGFIGGHLIRSTPAHWTVVATYLRSTTFVKDVCAADLHHVEPYRVDFTCSSEVESFARKHPCFDACVYLAANGDPALSVVRPAFDLEANTVGLVKLLERTTFGTLIYFSSGAIYDGLEGPVSPTTRVSPKLPYAISKLASEQYVSHFRKAGRIENVCNVRFFGAYGPQESSRKIYNRLVRQFASDRNPVFPIRGDGLNLIDAMWIDDAIMAIHVLLQQVRGDLIVDLASGTPLTVAELVRRAGIVFNLTAEAVYSGEVPEYIQFHSEDTTMRASFGFTPQFSLEAGLRLFAKQLLMPTAGQPES